MFLHKYVAAARRQRGFGMVDLVIGLAIMSLVTNGVMMTIFQIFKVAAADTNHLMATREVQNVGRWLSTDGQRAVTLATTPDADGFPLTLTWDDPNGMEYEVVYTLLPDNTLQRQHYTNRALNPDPDATAIAGRHIDPSGTYCSISATNELIVTIVVVVDVSQGEHTETRTFRVFPRRRLTS